MAGFDWTTVATFFGGVIVTLITAVSRRGVRRAEVEHQEKEGEASLSEATLAWARHLEESLTRQIETMKAESGIRIEALTNRVATLEAENDMYRRHVVLLMRQLAEAGIPPHPSPRDKHGET